MIDIEALNFAKGDGLVTVVAQDALSGAVLMVAHADRKAIARTIASGEMHYRSRTRGAWHKGATSGNVQRVVSLTADCDGDAVLARVLAAGPTCHVGSTSCFGAGEGDALGTLDATIARRRAAALPAALPGALPGAPSGEEPGYTGRLLADRNLRLKKIGEEAAELVTACADSDAERAAEEAADLLYHTLVALHATGASLADVQRVLDGRRR